MVKSSMHKRLVGTIHLQARGSSGNAAVRLGSPLQARESSASQGVICKGVGTDQIKKWEGVVSFGPMSGSGESWRHISSLSMFLFRYVMYYMLWFQVLALITQQMLLLYQL